MIKHIVMIKMKRNNMQELSRGVGLIENALNSLPKVIEEIIDFEVGINFNKSERAYDIVLLSSFNDEEGLEAYRIHPEHIKVVTLIKKYTENTIVVDYKI